MFPKSENSTATNLLGSVLPTRVYPLQSNKTTIYVHLRVSSAIRYAFHTIESQILVGNEETVEQQDDEVDRPLMEARRPCLNKVKVLK